MMRRMAIFLVLLGGFWWGAGAWRAAGDSPWTLLGDGLEMRAYHVLAGTSNVAIYAFRTSPGRLGLASGDYLTGDEWRAKVKARVAVNGGYFDESNQPLGLRVSGRKKFSGLRAANWGVFYIRHGKAFIVHTRNYKPSKNTEMAVQCGPRLVVAGKTTDLKPQWGRRTALGIDGRGRVVVAIADGEMSFDQWAAQWASRDGMDCRDALNLDGGGSTQLGLAAAQQRLKISGLWAVPDAVYIR